MFLMTPSCIIQKILRSVLYVSPSIHLLQEGGLNPVPKSKLLSNTQRRVVQRESCADKARDCAGKGHLGRGQQGKGTQKDCCAGWRAVLGFVEMGLVSMLSLSDRPDSGSFLVLHSLLSQEGG